MTTDRIRVACLQLSPGADVAANIVEVRRLVRQAKAEGANLIATPEYVGALDTSSRIMRELAMPETGHTVLKAFQELAVEHGVWLLAGSLTVKTQNDRIANRSFLIGDRGEVRATYDKLHMFDATRADGRAFRESGTYQAGEYARVAETPFGRVGMSICYDVRFPQLYRAIAKEGARLIFAPSSFHEGGRDVWHVLLRARAIETSAYIVAPATCGAHATNGKTVGHSLIVNPRGHVLADAGEEPGIIVADIDLSESEQIRERMPSLRHDRGFKMHVG